jgi:hypothetical protein
VARKWSKLLRCNAFLWKHIDGILEKEPVKKINYEKLPGENISVKNVPMEKDGTGSSWKIVLDKGKEFILKTQRTVNVCEALRIIKDKHKYENIKIIQIRLKDFNDYNWKDYSSQTISKRPYNKEIVKLIVSGLGFDPQKEEKRGQDKEFIYYCEYENLIKPLKLGTENEFTLAEIEEKVKVNAKTISEKVFLSKKRKDGSNDDFICCYDSEGKRSINKKGDFELKKTIKKDSPNKEKSLLLAPEKETVVSVVKEKAADRRSKPKLTVKKLENVKTAGKRIAEKLDDKNIKDDSENKDQQLFDEISHVFKGIAELNKRLNQAPVSSIKMISHDEMLELKQKVGAAIWDAVGIFDRLSVTTDDCIFSGVLKTQMEEHIKGMLQKVS